MVVTGRVVVAGRWDTLPFLVFEPLALRKTTSYIKPIPVHLFVLDGSRSARIVGGWSRRCICAPTIFAATEHRVSFAFVAHDPLLLICAGTRDSCGLGFRVVSWSGAEPGPITK